jgi:hypothetical protein
LILLPLWIGPLTLIVLSSTLYLIKTINEHNLK